MIVKDSDMIFLSHLWFQQQYNSLSIWRSRTNKYRHRKGSVCFLASLSINKIVTNALLAIHSTILQPL